MTQSDGDRVRSERIGQCLLIHALMARITTSSRSCLSVTNLPVAVTTPTVDIAVVSNGACVPLTCSKRKVLSFEWVIIPLPRDVACNGTVSNDVRALGAWRQRPDNVERERCRGGTARIVGVNGVGRVARYVLWRAPDAAVGCPKGEPCGQRRRDFPRGDRSAGGRWRDGGRERSVVGDFNRRGIGNGSDLVVDGDVDLS